MTNQFTFAPDPDEISLRAARALDAIGLPANGTFLIAAEALVVRGNPITKEALADALHEQEA